MKILFISIPSIHFIRWINQLDLVDFDLYYYNLHDKEFSNDLLNCKVINHSTYKSIRPFKGELTLKKINANWYQTLDDVFSKIEISLFEKIVKDLKPDIVQAFELNTSAYPIVSVMNRYKKIKFIYSVWGSDFYFFKTLKTHVHKIYAVLKRVDYLFTDCYRDFILANEMGYEGKYLGNYPGGGGYKLIENIDDEMFISKRNVILIKGYEHQFGRSINILKAVYLIREHLKDYEIIVFSANQKAIEYLKTHKEYSSLNITILNKDNSLTHTEFLELFKTSKIYIGNSISDGIPNTLLEAIVSGTFPIQSNPGGASSEVITHGINGFLINDPNNINEIADLIKKSISDEFLIKSAFKFNLELAKNKLEYNFIKEQVIKAYRSIEIEN